MISASVHAVSGTNARNATATVAACCDIVSADGRTCLKVAVRVLVASVSRG